MGSIKNKKETNICPNTIDIPKKETLFFLMENTGQSMNVWPKLVCGSFFPIGHFRFSQRGANYTIQGRPLSKYRLLHLGVKAQRRLEGDKDGGGKSLGWRWLCGKNEKRNKKSLHQGLTLLFYTSKPVELRQLVIWIICFFQNR